MNSIQSILVVCFLAFAACDAKILSRRELQTRATRPPCGNCSLANVNLAGLTEALKDLGPALQKATTLLGDALENLLSNLQDLKDALQKVIKSIRDTIGPVLDKLYEAVKNIETCPALKDLFKNLKDHLVAILDILATEWIPLINAPDLPSTLAALSVALQKALPDIFKLLRDLFYNLLQVLGLFCDTLGLTVWDLLDLPNALYNILLCLLKTLGGNFVLCFLKSLLGGLAAPLGLIGNPTGIDINSLTCMITTLLNIPNQLCSKPTCVTIIPLTCLIG